MHKVRSHIARNICNSIEKNDGHVSLVRCFCFNSRMFSKIFAMNSYIINGFDPGPREPRTKFGSHISENFFDDYGLGINPSIIKFIDYQICESYLLLGLE